jgi:hypothetical protein
MHAMIKKKRKDGEEALPERMRERAQGKAEALLNMGTFNALP